MNCKGQIFKNLLVFSVISIMFILASPILFSIISSSVGSMGSATAFIVKSIMWIMLIVVVAFLLAIASSGEGFFFG